MEVNNSVGKRCCSFGFKNVTIHLFVCGKHYMHAIFHSRTLCLPEKCVVMLSLGTILLRMTRTTIKKNGQLIIAGAI